MAIESRDEVRLRLLTAATQTEQEYGVPNRRIAVFASWLEPGQPIGLMDVNEVIAIAADLLLEGDLRLAAWWLDIAAGVARTAMEPRRPQNSPRSAWPTYEQSAASMVTDSAIRSAIVQGRHPKRPVAEPMPATAPIPGYGSPAGYDFSQGRQATMSVDSLKAVLDSRKAATRKPTKRAKPKKRVRRGD